MNGEYKVTDTQKYNIGLTEKVIMILTETQLKKLIHGACEFKSIDGYLAAYRFLEKQIKALEFDDFFHVRSRYTAGISIRMKTDAEEIGFDYRLITGSLKDSVDVYVNDRIFSVCLMEALNSKGTLSLHLPDGNKEVSIYLPTDVEMQIRNFRVEKKWRPIFGDIYRVLWLGDSITQGVGSFMGGQTFVNLVSRKLKYESLNQGIGGYGYLDRVLEGAEGIRPDKIVVALGTNDRLEGLERRIADFYKALNEIYRDIPVLAITPIWREDNPEKLQDLKTIKSIIESVAFDYPNVCVVDGFDLVPPVTYCFMDGLHPNAWGMEVYANNLANKILELNF